MEDKVKLRTKLRTKATKTVNDTKAYRTKEVRDLDPDFLAYKLHQLKGLREELNTVQTLLDKEGNTDESGHSDLPEEEIFMGTRLLARIESGTSGGTPDQDANPGSDLRSSLVVNIPAFDGDLMKWRAFWELFSVSIHQNGRYANIQKFVLLKSHLTGAAERAIEGVPVSGDGYITAIQLLEKRFHRDDLERENLMKQLLDAPTISNGNDLKAMRKLTDHLTAHTRALVVLGVAPDSFADFLLPVMRDKIPESWRLEWARQRKSSYQDFLKFLEQEVTLRETARPTEKATSPGRPSASPSTTSTLSVQRQKPGRHPGPKDWQCEACGTGKHGLNKCQKYHRMSVDERWRVVRRAGVCYQCLGPHKVRSCQSQPCPTCREPHHSSLHYLRHSSVSPQLPPPPAAAVAPPPALVGGQVFLPANADRAGSRQQQSRLPERQNYNVAAHAQPCYYQTAVAEARGPKGSRMVRILLDGASDSSYVRTSLVEELGLEVTGSGTFACMGFQEKREEPRRYDKVRANLRSRFEDCSVDLELWSTDRLCAPAPATATPPLPTSISERLADDFTGGPIDILIGIDRLYDVVLWEQVEISHGLRAIDTTFGYIIHGRSDVISDQPQRHIFHSRTVERMWDLDLIGISGDEEDTDRSSRFPKPTWSDTDQRYEMGLMWKTDSRPVSNYRAIKNRTGRMIESLGEESTTEYQEKLSDMLRDEVIEEAPSTSAGGEVGTTGISPAGTASNRSATSTEPSTAARSGEDSSLGIPPVGEASDTDAFFLPHHGIRQNGKLRIVFDGSAKDGTGQSLNDYLNPGENLLRQLSAVVLCFRTGNVACQADIKAAFHQVAIPESDRRYLQFLWHDQVLRFARVPFGLSCSPYMLLKTISMHVAEYAGTDPELCSKIMSGSYMDDICITFKDKEEAQAGIERVGQIFSDARMELHKVRTSGETSPPSKLLGMLWSTETDYLADVIPDIPCPSTKSELLSAVAKPFDPLGVLTPWLIGAKIIFQSTWRSLPTLGWDDPLPADAQRQVEKWWSGTSKENVPFPRVFAHLGETEDVTFHVFCDASKSAYCTAVYAEHGGESRLVMAKGRLAPLNPHLTIPRLELMAALIGARLMNFIQQTLKLDSPVVVFWTDSTDVLHWLWNVKPRKVFVENRVLSILALTRPEQWRHVRGIDNPADLGTRGTSLSELGGSKMWWNGPSFILGDFDPNGSTGSPEPLSASATKETKETKEETTPKFSLVVNETTSIQQRQRIFDITTCSTLKQVVNRTSWAMRFVRNARGDRANRTTGPLTPEERRDALHFWIREAQQNAFHADLEALENGRSLLITSQLTKLRPQLDESGIICSVPRTNEPMLPVLPELAYITTLIIDEAHQRCFHQGVRATLALLSGEYLVRRRSVKRVVDTCRRCRRYRGLNYRPDDGSLPSFRTEPSRPFAKVGMVFFGPLYVSDNKKVWVLLITCATSRAVHLELVASQGVEDVKLALRRFFALRGTPVLVFSDNARTFHALLSHIPSSVTWRFIPEAAPWWGGFWERLVGLTKKCLKITLHQCRLSHDELAVTLYELAYHLNLRPLATVDAELLTPAHLLFGVTSISGILAPLNEHLDRLDRAWKHRKRVCDHLIARWTKEYVATLRSWTVSPRGRPVRLPQVGDLVLVHAEGPRGRWPLARVDALITGADGRSRAAAITMRDKQTRRSVSKLYHLEANGSP